jgi:hypothetical protein
MTGAEGHHVVNQRLDALADKSLDNVALDGEAHAGKSRDAGAVARNGEADLARADKAARCLDPHDAPLLDADAGHFAILDDIDATRVGATGIAPSHGVMTHCAAAPLQQSAANGEARIGEIGEVEHIADLLAAEQFGIDAGKTHGVAAPRIGIPLGV